MKKKFLFMPGFLILSMPTTFDLSKQCSPQINWQMCIGGTGEENILSMIKLKDGNFLYCGFTDSHDGDFDAKDGGSDAFLMKTDGGRNIIWKNVYGGNHDEVFYSVIETTNGDILAIGTSGSNDKRVTNHHGTPGTDDIWLVKTNNNGNLIKDRCFGGSSSESTVELGMSEGLMIDKKGNILFVGETNSTDGDPSLSNKPNHGNYDGWVVKLDPITWTIIQSTTIGDAAYDALYNIHEINGYYFVTGTKSTIAYSHPGIHVEPFYKAFAAKLDESALDMIWFKTYGGAGSDDCNASVISQDGNLVLTGHAASSDGDCAGNSGFNTWTWKIKAEDGTIEWKKFIGVAGDTSAAFNITATSDDGFIIVGGIMPRVDRYLFDAYTIKFNSEGDTLWTKSFGGNSGDELLAVAEEDNTSILVAGLTSSKNINGYHIGPVTSQNFLKSSSGKRKGPTADAWIIKLKE
jgi:hypothetical protein